MVTYTVYGHTDDHYTKSESTTWANARSGGGTVTAGAATDASSGGVGYVAASGTPDYECYQSHLIFDTSAVPTGFSESCELRVVVIGQTTTFDVDARIHDWAGGTSSFLPAADIPGETAFGTATWASGAATKTIDGPTALPRSASLKITLTPTVQQTAAAPANGGSIANQYWVNESGTANDPRLVIEVVPFGTAYEMDCDGGSFAVGGGAAEFFGWEHVEPTTETWTESSPTAATWTEIDPGAPTWTET